MVDGRCRSFIQEEKQRGRLVLPFPFPLSAIAGTKNSCQKIGINLHQCSLKYDYVIIFVVWLYCEIMNTDLRW